MFLLQIINYRLWYLKNIFRFTKVLLLGHSTHTFARCAKQCIHPSHPSVDQIVQCFLIPASCWIFRGGVTDRAPTCSI